MSRRLVITICPREPGRVTLSLERGGPPVRLGAAEIARHLDALIARRDLAARVQVQQGCAGGCAGSGPNVSVTFYAMPPPGEKPDHVALGWRTYVESLATLPYLAKLIDENLDDEPERNRIAAEARRTSREAAPSRRRRPAR